MQLASSIRRALVVLTMDRTRCGAARPTKAIRPVCATAVPVASASTATSAARMGPSGSPRLRAVASPRLSPSSTRASSQAASAHSAHTDTISTQAVQPTKLVEPSMKACMACSDSGENSSTRCVMAPSTTPTTTPASSRRSVCCTPRESSSVSSTANTAPRKAAPVRPRRTQALLENTLTAPPPFIMLAPSMPAPPPIAASASATPSEAPEALPSKNGSASGLRNRPCATAPARPSKAPAPQAPRVRGRRMSHTICCAMAVAAGSMSGWSKGPIRFSKPALPTQTPSTASASAASSKATTSQDARWAFTRPLLWSSEHPAPSRPDSAP